MSTIFKKIIDKQIPAKIIYEDDKCLAFHDVNPQAPIHVLVIPKKEIRSLNEASTSDRHVIGHCLLKCADLARDLGVAETGYRVVANTNGHGGQTVFHLHFHLLAGRALTWPPG